MLPLAVPTLAERARRQGGVPVVLALDLGTTMGFAIRHVDGRVASGTLKFESDAREHWGRRFLKFRRWLTDVKASAGGEIESVIYERVDFGRDLLAVKVYAGFEAVLCLWAEHFQIPYRGIAPATLKKFATGSGRAEKQDVMFAVERAFGIAPKTSHEGDALALLAIALERDEGGRLA